MKSAGVIFNIGPLRWKKLAKGLSDLGISDRQIATLISN